MKRLIFYLQFLPLKSARKELFGFKLYLKQIKNRLGENIINNVIFLTILKNIIYKSSVITFFMQFYIEFIKK